MGERRLGSLHSIPSYLFFIQLAIIVIGTLIVPSESKGTQDGSKRPVVFCTNDEVKRYIIQLRDEAIYPYSMAATQGSDAVSILHDPWCLYQVDRKTLGEIAPNHLMAALTRMIDLKFDQITLNLSDITLLSHDKLDSFGCLYNRSTVKTNDPRCPLRSLSEPINPGWCKKSANCRLYRQAQRCSVIYNLLELLRLEASKHGSYKEYFYRNYRKSGIRVIALLCMSGETPHLCEDAYQFGELEPHPFCNNFFTDFGVQPDYDTMETFYHAWRSIRQIMFRYHFAALPALSWKNNNLKRTFQYHVLLISLWLSQFFYRTPAIGFYTKGQMKRWNCEGTTLRDLMNPDSDLDNNCQQMRIAISCEMLYWTLHMMFMKHVMVTVSGKPAGDSAYTPLAVKKYIEGYYQNSQLTSLFDKICEDSPSNQCKVAYEAGGFKFPVKLCERTINSAESTDSYSVAKTKKERYHDTSGNVSANPQTDEPAAESGKLQLAAAMGEETMAIQEHDKNKSSGGETGVTNEVALGTESILGAGSMMTETGTAEDGSVNFQAKIFWKKCAVTVQMGTPLFVDHVEVKAHLASQTFFIKVEFSEKNKHQIYIQGKRASFYSKEMEVIPRCHYNMAYSHNYKLNYTPDNKLETVDIQFMQNMGWMNITRLPNKGIDRFVKMAMEYSSMEELSKQMPEEKWHYADHDSCEVETMADMKPRVEMLNSTRTVRFVGGTGGRRSDILKSDANLNASFTLRSRCYFDETSTMTGYFSDNNYRIVLKVPANPKLEDPEGSADEESKLMPNWHKIKYVPLDKFEYPKEITPLKKFLSGSVLDSFGLEELDDEDVDVIGGGETGSTWKLALLKTCCYAFGTVEIAPNLIVDVMGFIRIKNSPNFQSTSISELNLTGDTKSHACAVTPHTTYSVNHIHDGKYHIIVNLKRIPDGAGYNELPEA